MKKAQANKSLEITVKEIVEMEIDPSIFAIPNLPRLESPDQ